MNAFEIRSALTCGKPSCPCGNSRSSLTHCCSHNDGSPSLSVRDGQTAPLVTCQTGCSREDVIAALKERGLWPEKGESAPRRQTNEPVAQYRYTDAEGNLLGIKGRFEWVEGGERKKSFRWKLPGSERWAGLDGAGVESMPLYNLAGVLAHPDKPVIVTEGEKAATALIERGVVAVCLSGGAAQKRFGNALDPLKGRDVILWPDNDGPGEALMGRIAAILPNAGFVRPTLGPKEDAFDYFEAGGTIQALDDLYQSSQPDVEVVSPTSVRVTLHQPAGDIRFAFSEMVAGPKSLDVVLEITSYLRRTPYRTRVNILSQSARSGIVTELNNVFDFDPRSKETPFKWASLLSEACNLAEEAWKGIDRSVSMSDVQLTTVREWFLEGICPRRLVTIPFGMGGSTKSLVWGVLLPLCALYGEPFLGVPVQHVDGLLIVDYEDTEEEWKLRFYEVAKGLGIEIADEDWSRIRYMPGAGIPLVDQAETIRRIHAEHPFNLLVVDSAISAVGGDLLDLPAAQRIVNWLTTFGADYDVTSVLLAHTTKADDEKAKQYPYGNIFWHNLPRSTVYVEAHQETGSKEVQAKLHPRKASRGSSHPIYYTVTFPAKDGEGTLFKAQASEHPAFKESKAVYQMTVKEAIQHTLERMQVAYTYSGLTERINADGKKCSEQTVRNEAGDLLKAGKIHSIERNGITHLIPRNMLDSGHAEGVW